jgi:hypothetical protein
MATKGRHKRHRKGKRRRVPNSYGPLVATTALLPKRLRATLDEIARELGYTLSHAIVAYMLENLEGKSATHRPTKKHKRR